MTGFEDLVPPVRGKGSRAPATATPSSSVSSGFEDLIPTSPPAPAARAAAPPAAAGSGFEDLIPTAAPKGVVRAGPLQNLGPADDPETRKTLSGLVASHNLYTDLELARHPETAARLQPDIARATAPSALYTAADIATGNMMAPLSERAAAAAADGSLERYAAGGGDPGEHANLFGVAAALGAVAGNAIPIGAERAAAATVPKAIAEAAPVATTAARRVLAAAKSGAKVNATIAAGGTALFGDDDGRHDLGAIGKSAVEGGVVGFGTGGALGGAMEAAPATARAIGRLGTSVREAVSDLPLRRAVPALDDGAPTMRRRVAELVDPSVKAEVARATEQRNVAERTANTDELTGLGNTRAYRAALATAESDPATTVVRFDVNNFKAVNDTHGHEAGDAALQEIGEALTRAAQETGVPARLFRPGGDEYAALVPAEQAAAFRDRAEALYGVKEHGAGVRTSISGGLGDSDALADADTYARKAIHKAEQGLPLTRPGVVGHVSAAQAADIAATHGNLPTAAEGPVYTTAEGLQHLWDLHSEQLRPLGYDSPEQFAESVGSGFTEIRRGAGPNSRSIILAKPTADGAHILHATLDAGAGPAAWEVGSGHAMRPRSLAQRTLLSEPAHPGPGGPDLASTLPPGNESSQRDGSLAPGSALTARQQLPETSAEPGTPSSTEPPGPDPAAAGDDLEYRHSGPGFVPKVLEALRTAYRGAMVTPYAGIEGEAPALVDALHTAGAARAAAQHVAERRAQWVLEGLTDEQRTHFGKQLVTDNLEAEGTRKGEAAQRLLAQHRAATADELRDGLTGAANQLERRAAALPPSDRTRYALRRQADDLRARLATATKTPDLVALADEHFARPLDETSQRFFAHAAEIRQDLPADVDQQPWFQDALAKHRTYVEPTMTTASVGAGVDPASFRQPASSYVKLVSEDRLTNAEIRRAMDAAEVSDPGELKPRGKLARFFVGEKPELQRLFPKGTAGLRQGPINPNSPSLGSDVGPRRGGASVTGSTKGAAGTAREYVTDYQRVLRQDAHDKIARAANNAVYDEVAKVGRPLGAGEEPALGKVAVAREILDPLSGEPTLQRFEVPRKVAAAIRKYEQQQAPVDFHKQLWRKTTGALTRAQISGMPVEATSHMNTLASIVASVPGEKDVAGKAMAAVPGLGAKAAAIREMTRLDFADPQLRALESRLADIGALRIDEDRGGLVNTAHHALFGPEGVDVRGRLVLARKYLDRKPDATDAELREFVTSKLGNYVRANSGAAVNALQDTGISAFARFQAARIPASIRSTFGASDLPATSSAQRAMDVASTLYRGPLGYAVAGDLANRAVTGHGFLDNEPGHHGDVATGFYATPDGIKRMTEGEAAAYGSRARPLYLPLATLNPVLATGLRASGARGLALGNGNRGTRTADALRDVENTGLGVVGPAVRAGLLAASGRAPYLLSDGSMLPVTKPEFDKGHEMSSRVKTALHLANPALATIEFGGAPDDHGSSLQSALAHDDQWGGGPQSIAAGVASFLLPRIASVGVGGADNEGSELAQAERDYRDVMASYKSELRRAPGPKSEDEIIARAVADAARDGRFDPDVVQRELEKFVRVPDAKRDATRERGQRRFERTKLTRGGP